MKDWLVARWNRTSKKALLGIIGILIVAVNRKYRLLTEAEVAMILGMIGLIIGSRAFVEAMGGTETHLRKKG